MAPRIGICFSTKDRVDYTTQTAPALLRTEGIDVIWVDGSVTEDGKALPLLWADKTSVIREVHHEVRGGPDVAILYSLKRLYDLGYDYCGILENDVLLEDGWLDRLMELFSWGERNGIAVGGATVCSFKARELVDFGPAAVISHLGACMAVFPRAVIPLLLAHYRTSTIGEVRSLFRRLWRLDIQEWEEGRNYALSTDCFYASILATMGYACLATVPTAARSIDEHLVGPNWRYSEGSDAEAPENAARARLFLNTHMPLVRRHGPLAMVADHYGPGWTVYMPQVLWRASGYLRLTGEPTYRWLQNYGPFAVTLQKPGEGIALSFFGKSMNFIFSSGAESGSISVTVNGITARCSLAKEAGLHVLPIQGVGEMTEVTLTAEGDGLAVLAALRFAEEQPWFDRVPDFDSSLSAGLARHIWGGGRLVHG